MNVSLNGKDYLIQYPFAACRALERELGKSTFEFFEDLSNGRVGIDGMVALIWAGILHANKAVTIDMVSLWLDDSKTPVIELYQGCLAEYADAVQSKLGVPSGGGGGTEKN